MAQLLQIEEVQLNHKRCGFNYAQLGTPKLAIFMSFGEFITYFVRLFVSSRVHNIRVLLVSCKCLSTCKAVSKGLLS